MENINLTKLATWQLKDMKSSLSMIGYIKNTSAYEKQITRIQAELRKRLKEEYYAKRRM